MNNSRSASLNAAEFLDTFPDGLTFGKKYGWETVHVSRVKTSISGVRDTDSALLRHWQSSALSFDPSPPTESAGP